MVGDMLGCLPQKKKYLLEEKIRILTALNKKSVCNSRQAGWT